MRARLTAEGWCLVEQVFPKLASTVAKLAGHLGADEQKQLRQFLKHIGK